MSNPFYYMGGFILLAAYPLGYEPLALAKEMVAPWAAAGALLVYAGICWSVLSRGPEQPQLARFALRLLALVVYALLIFVFHFPLWVWQLGVEEDPLLSSLLSLAPLFALYGILALIHARTEPRSSGGLGFAFRGFL